MARRARGAGDRDRAVVERRDDRRGLDVVIRAAVLAMIVCTAAVARADETGELVVEGDVRAAAGDVSGALARYQKALAQDPDRLDVYDKAVPLWIAAEDWTDATTWLEKATLREPRYAAGWYALGYVYRRTGRIAAAVGAYQEYVALRPQDAAGRFGLAVAAEIAGDRAAALASYRRYLAMEHDASRSGYRAEARIAIERLTPAPATWAEALDAIVTGRATLSAWTRIVAAP
jgi:tetratricopeptide (TPR) repeat protein